MISLADDVEYSEFSFTIDGPNTEQIDIQEMCLFGLFPTTEDTVISLFISYVLLDVCRLLVSPITLHLKLKTHI